ncbi:MAG TPA: BF3164 family lipoprotein [Longimicrobiales bacterium]|nr:BF3164 family lipoprotein [Longimicrobiales bacterium]
MSLKRFSLILLLPALAACGDLSARTPSVDGPASFDHAAFHPAQLTGRVLNDDPSLAMPTYVAVVGGDLVLVDPRADSTIKEIDRSDGTLVRQFGRHGEGPGEFEGPWSIDPVPGSNSRFWVYDLTLTRSTLVDLKTDFDGEARLGDRMMRLHGSALLEPIRVRNRIVSLGFFQKGRFAVLDDHGAFLGTVGPTPLPEQTDIPAFVRQQAYQSRMKANPSRTLLAVATRQADRLEIYRPDGTLLTLAQRPFHFDPVFKVEEKEGRPVIATGDNLRFGYISLATTDRRIYALFSGRTRAGFPGEANYGRYIHVFDWSGRLLRVLKLDAAAFAVATDPGGHTLYTIRHEPTPAIMTYDLDRLAIN